MEIESREKVKRLLRELFQFDSQDLDFGIYRIMNFKRDAIEKFIEKDLLEAAEAEFREFAKVGLGDLQSDVERLKAEINRDFGAGTIDEHGRVIRHEDAPKIQQYLSKLKELESAQITQAQIDDVFNHIYEFFSRYYDKGDFLSKRRFGGREKYYVPYNGEETLLHWATSDQYYVKTGEYFKRYRFRTGAYLVNFILKEAEVDPNSVKGGNRYFLLHEGDAFRLDETNRELDIHFNYRELTDDEKRRYGIGNVQGKITSGIVNEILSKIGDKGVGGELRKKATGDEISVLEQHIRKYVTRNTTDYFIHKNLKTFLERELEFYLKNEVLDLDEIEQMDERNIRLNKAKIRAIKGISSKIINFLAQIEDFQKELFEKKKFVLKTGYCMTLDLVPDNFYEEIGKNEKQVVEWKELFNLDETTKNTLQSTVGKKVLNVDFLKSHKNLVLDTKFFGQEFVDKIFNSSNDLDDKIGGMLVKSENFQAINLLYQRYEGQVDCIYIDPPYNTGNDEFLYKDNYQHSSWLSMMFDRLYVARKLMSDGAVIFVSIDDHEAYRLRILGESLYGPDTNGTTKKRHFVGLLPTIQNLKGNNDQFGFAGTHEYTLVYVKNPEQAVLNELPLKSLEIEEEYDEEDEVGRYKEGAPLKSTGRNAPRELRPNLFYPIWIGPNNEISLDEKRGLAKVMPITDGQEMSWRWSKEYLSEHLNDVIIKRSANGEISLYRKQRLGDLSESEYLQTYKPKSILYRPEYSSTVGTEELKDIMGGRVYNNPKSVNLIKDLLNVGSEKDSLILDFFVGSGTTAQAVLEINSEDGGNRKYICVEMANYFEDILKPRIQRLMYSKNWRNGFPTSNIGMSHMFKYIYLEQYEDALNNIVFRSLDKSVQETLDSFGDYFVRYMLDYETRDSPTRLVLDKFQTPFDYKIRVSKTGKKEEYTTVDLVETFNYLLGLWVEKLRVFKDGEQTYRVVFGKKDEDSVVVVWRNTKDLNLERDKKFVEETILAGYEARTIYINGDSYVKNAQPIEPEFKRLMGA